VLHALPSGYRFDLGARALLPSRLAAVPGQRRAGRRGRTAAAEEQEASDA
jgi:hypothetical protein